jgi:hypothetical protein
MAGGVSAHMKINVKSEPSVCEGVIQKGDPGVLCSYLGRHGGCWRVVFGTGPRVLGERQHLKGGISGMLFPFQSSINHNTYLLSPLSLGHFS